MIIIINKDNNNDNKYKVYQPTGYTMPCHDLLLHYIENSWGGGGGGERESLDMIIRGWGKRYNYPSQIVYCIYV